MYRGHGTHVAGIIERTMASGIASGSTVPRVQLMSLKVYGHKINATTWTIIKAINFAKQNGAKIISASFGSL